MGFPLFVQSLVQQFPAGRYCISTCCDES